MEINLQTRNSHEISSASTFPVAIKTVMGRAGLRLGASFRACWRPDLSGNVLVATEVWAESRLPIEELVRDAKIRSISRGEGMVGEAWRTDKWKISHDCTIDMPLPRALWAFNAGLKCGVWIPFHGRAGAGVFEFLTASDETIVSNSIVELSEMISSLCRWTGTGAK